MLYSLLDSPGLFVKPPRKSAMCNTKPARPLPQSVCFTVVCQPPSLAGVLSLFQRGSPFAICRPAFFNALLAMTTGIISVVINSLYAVFFGGLLSHVCKKLRKRVTPVLAYTYPASTMPVVSSVVRVVAPSPHFLPGRILRRLISASSACTMATARLNRLPFEISTSHGRRISALTDAIPARVARLGFSSKLDHCELVVLTANFVRAVFAASARLDVSRPKGTSAKDLLSAALAAAQPVRASLAPEIGTSVADSHKFAESLSSDVFDVRASDSRIIRRHSSTPRKLDCDIEPERSTTTALARFILA